MSFLSNRLTRIAAGVAVVSAIAVSPAAAQGPTDATGTLDGGALVATPPVITPFNYTLTGVTAPVTAAVAAYNVNDATGTNAGYSVAVTASAPTVGGSAANAGTGSTLTLDPGVAAATAGNPTLVGPVAAGGPVLLDPITPITVQNAIADTGQGSWDVSGGAAALSVVIPGNADAGAFVSTLTFTTAPAA